VLGMTTADGRATQWAAHVADEIGQDVPLHEAPLPGAACEAVVIAAADDCCRAMSGSACSAVKYERETAVPASSLTSIARFVVRCLVRGVPSSLDDHVVAEHLLDGLSASHRPGTAHKGGVREQHPDPCEVAVVHELGVACDEALDRPVA
jgi:hypothetical protein